MKQLLSLAIVLVASTSLADNHRAPRPATPPRGKDAGVRTVGVHVVAHPDRPFHPKDNPAHEVIIHDPKTNKDEHHVVVVDHRPAHVIDHDHRLRVVVRGYHPTHDWVRFHDVRGGWWKAWGITAWDTVGTVTCEAANESTGELFPVSEDRDARGWDDDTVNTILDQALDDCYAEANGAACGPATPSCTFQPY
jgi:hypothetical protein